MDFERVWNLSDPIFHVIFRHVSGRTLLALEGSCRRFRKIIRFGMKDRIPKIWREDMFIYGARNHVHVFIGDKFVGCSTPDILKT